MKTDFLRIAWRNLGRNWGRNLATGSAIAFGFVGVHMLGAYSNRIENLIRVHTNYVLLSGHVQIYKQEGLNLFSYEPGKYSLNAQEQGQIQAILGQYSGIERSAGFLSGSGLVGNGCRSFPFNGKGLEPGLMQWALGRPILRKWLPEASLVRKGEQIWNYEAESQPVLLSVGLAKLLKKSKTKNEFSQIATVFPNCNDPSEEIFSADPSVQFITNSWSGSMGALDGDVVGHYSTGFAEADGAGAIMHLSNLQKLLDTDHVSHINVWLYDYRKAGKFKEWFDQQANTVGLRVDSHLWDEEAVSPYYHGTIRFIYSLFTFLGIILCSIITLSVLNSATMTIMERSREIGMYRSLGYRQNQLAQIFLMEALFLFGIALGFGIFLGGIVIGAVNRSHVRFTPPGMSDPIQLLLVPNWTFSFFCSLFIGFLVLATTHLAVRLQLRANVAWLLGNLNR